jgi:hypothetical protein
MATAERIEALRDWLRDPHYAIGSRSSTDVHRRQLEDIWEEALYLARGDIKEALTVAVEATKSGPQAGEVGKENRDRFPEEYARYQARLAGIPSKAFGSVDPFTGVDKVQHFFRSAELAIALENPGTAYLAGAAYEGLDWIRDVFGRKDTGGFDQGDLWADNLGAMFGISLTFDRDRSISLFLQSAIPENDIMVMRMNSAYEGGYIAEIVVPSAERQAAGDPVEVRCIDDDGYPYVMQVKVSGGADQVTYQRRGTSGYQFSRNDPWYRRDPQIEPAPYIPHRSDDPGEMYIRNQRSPTADALARHEAITERLNFELGNLERQNQFAREQFEQARQAHEKNYYSRLLADSQERIEDHNRRLEKAREVHERLHERLRDEAATRAPLDLTPNTTIHENIAAQQRAQQILQQREAERERREADERARKEQERQQHEHEQRQRLHEQLREQREQHHREHDHRHEPAPLPPPVINVSNVS